jgi:hypothetical protein
VELSGFTMLLVSGCFGLCLGSQLVLKGCLSLELVGLWSWLVYGVGEHVVLCCGFGLRVWLRCWVLTVPVL